MKRITIMIAAVLLLISLGGCGKKNKNVSLTIVDENGVETSYNVSTPEERLSEVIASLAPVVSFNEKAEDGHWELYVNDVQQEFDLKTTNVVDQDRIRIVFVRDFAQEPEPVLTGAWEIWQAYSENLKNDESVTFQKAMEGFTGVNYIPLKVLVKQTVTGTYSAYLCQGLTITAVPSVDYYIVGVDTDPDGISRIHAINKIELNDIRTTDDDMIFWSSWELADDLSGIKLNDEGAQQSFEKAVKAQEEMKYEPLQLLATQVVAGTNYKAICYGEKADQSAKGIYIVTWFAGLDGEAKITDSQKMNLEYYVSGE